jgi:hypothetical protein
LGAVEGLNGNRTAQEGQDAEEIQGRAQIVIQTRIFRGQEWVFFEKQLGNVLKSIKGIAKTPIDDLPSKLMKDVKEQVKDVAKDKLWQYLDSKEVETYSWTYKATANHDINHVRLNIIWDKTNEKYVAIFEGGVARKMKDALGSRVADKDCPTDPFKVIVTGTAKYVSGRFGGTQVRLFHDRVTWIQPR